MHWSLELVQLNQKIDWKRLSLSVEYYLIPLVEIPEEIHSLEQAVQVLLNYPLLTAFKIKQQIKNLQQIFIEALSNFFFDLKFETELNWIDA